MRTVLVSLVVGMGILIVLGIILLIYGLIQKSDNPDFKFFDLSGETPAVEETLESPEVPLVGAEEKKLLPAPVSSPRTLGDLTFEIPKGYKVVETDMQGSRLIVRLEDKTETRSRLLMFDLQSGASLGTLSLIPQP